MNNYEVVDLFEVGNAGSTIMDKTAPDQDENTDPVGVLLDAFEE